MAPLLEPLVSTSLPKSKGRQIQRSPNFHPFFSSRSLLPSKSSLSYASLDEISQVTTP
uniref:Uncharacterized protein n=1 Tax=Arundo donax TaxID=35708 RepID=A0A0A9CUZ2_ARUDO